MTPHRFKVNRKIACTAYTRYVLDIGQSEDWFGLHIGLLPCLLGYGKIARRLYDDPQTLRGSQNRYWKWIETYVAEDYTSAVDAGTGKLNFVLFIPLTDSTRSTC